VSLNDVPVSRKVGIGGCALKDDGGYTEHQRSVNDIGMTGNPADIAAAEVPVTLMDVKDIFASHGSTKKVSSCGMQNTLGLASGARSVEEEKRVFGSDGLRREVVGPLLDLLMPPEITTAGPWDFGTGTFIDQNILNSRALLKSIINNLLGANQLAATLAFVRCDDNLAPGIDNTVAEGVGREASEDN
jgi:hypothetical protein